MKQTLQSVFKYIILTLVLAVLLEPKEAHAQAGCGCDHIIYPGDVYVDGRKMNVKPGDVVCVMASRKRYLGIFNIHGAPGKPVTFINCGGQVIIKDTDWYYGMKFDNCSFFHVTGTGSGDYEFGFLIDGTPPLTTGLGISNFSTDMEIDHFEIARSNAGIMAKSDPDCSGKPNRGNFTQYNTVIHDNYIHDTDGEALYIGFPHYSGILRPCSDSTWAFSLPHDLKGVKIYRNKIHSTGKEGIQLGCAVEDVDIYENEIRNFGLVNQRYNRSGVYIATGTTGNLRNNVISDGTGPGIWLNGLGDNYIMNNLVVNVGQSGDEGILISDSLVAEKKGYHIINNTFVAPGGAGVMVNTERATTIDFINNIIAGPGQGYQDIPSSVIWNCVYNMYLPVKKCYFVNPGGGDFHLKRISPAVDEGMDVSSFGVIKDLEYTDRPKAKAYDIGCYESPYERLDLGFHVYPNPVYIHKGQFTHIRLVLADDTNARIVLYDLQGREVAVVADGFFQGGEIYEYRFHPLEVAQGMYFYVLETDVDRKHPQVVKVIVVE